VTATPDSSSQVTVGWGASTDAVGVASYEVQRNGTTVAPAVTGATSYVDSGVTASTTYSYTVSAVDAAGNRSAASAPVSATTPASAPALTASFTTSPSSGPAPLAVQFTDTSTGGPTGWSWTFGDGTTSNLQSPSHSYPAEGSYTATLTVTGASGSSTSPPQTVTVTSTPQPGGAVTVGGSDQAVSTTALSTVTVPRPATGVADNDVLIVQITTDGGPDISTTPTGWLPVITPQSVGTSARVFAYYRVISAAADEPATYTWGLSAAVKWNAAVTSFHGVDTANPFDTEASTSVSSTASTSRTVPEVTTTTAGTMLVGGMGPNSGTAGVTPPAGWTESVESSGGQVAELAYQARPTAGATGAATWKLGSSLGSAAWLTALRPI
jgi:PKD repeat protein